MRLMRLLTVCAVLTALLVTPVAAAASSSSDAAAQLNSLFDGPGVVFRGPENCVSDTAADPFDDPAALAYCAVKDPFGALGGPSAGGSVDAFVPAPNRFEFGQPLDCGATAPAADGTDDGCPVVTGAATLLRNGLPVRLFGVCARTVAKDCAVLGTITDPDWQPDGVFMLMDPAAVDVRCQYAQDAGRNGCNENDAYTVGQPRPSCSAQPTDPQCEFGADEREPMLAAYARYCGAHPRDCLENQLEAQWSPQSVLAIGYLARGDQRWDCPASRVKAQRFADAVNARWGMQLPLVLAYLDVAKGRVVFADADRGCTPP